MDQLLATIAGGGEAVAIRVGGFSDLLQQHRAVAGLSQDVLAKRTRLSWRRICDLDRAARSSAYPARGSPADQHAR